MDTDPPRDEAELTKGKSNIDITVRMIGHSAKTKGGWKPNIKGIGGEAISQIGRTSASSAVWDCGMCR